ncbi:MAG: hypothetical protein ACHQ6T_00435 [Myxococcota bacterium]
MSRPADTAVVAKRVLEALRERCWLLQADPDLPSVASLVAGEPIRGSWWSHPRSNLIFWVLEELEESPELLQLKLVKGKVTLVHRALWPPLLAVACSSQPWQSAGLSRAAQSLLGRARRAGTLRLDQLPRWSAASKPGDAARELERRLLVYSREIHTESGRHTRELESWDHLRARLRLPEDLPDPKDAKAALERVVSARLLPWARGARAKRVTKA